MKRIGEVSSKNVVSGSLSMTDKSAPIGYYNAPKDGWVCFHCGERFTSAENARLHFGFWPGEKIVPLCVLAEGDIKNIVKRYRWFELRLARFQKELENAGYSKVSAAIEVILDREYAKRDDVQKAVDNLLQEDNAEPNE